MSRDPADIIGPDIGGTDRRCRQRAIGRGGGCVTVSQLVIWSAVQAQWAACPTDEIAWLDRNRLSAGQDPTLHRSPRCAGLRYVHSRWELFSRDTTHQVFAAQYAGDFAVGYEMVQATAKHV